MAKELTELKCRDCIHCHSVGWWNLCKVCDISGFPVDVNESACISVLPKKTIKITNVV